MTGYLPAKDERQSGPIFGLAKLCLVCLFSLLSFHNMAATLSELAIPSVTLQPGESHSYTTHSAYLEDPSGDWNLEQVIEQDIWQGVNAPSLNLGYSAAGYWLATRLNTQDLSATWYLRSRYTLFDQFDVYVCPEGKQGIDLGSCDIRLSGDRRDFSYRDFNHPEFTLNLAFQNTQPHWVFIQVKTEGTFALLLKVADKRVTIDGLMSNTALQGAYIAMLFIMGLYNLFIFFSTRDKSYLYYSCFVLTFMMFHMTYSNSAFQLFWPNNPDVNGYALPIIFSINMIFMALFISKFLDLKRHGKRSLSLFRVYFWLGVIMLVANAFLSYQLLMKLVNLLAMAMGISGIAIGALFWKKGVSSARFFTIAWVAFIFGIVLASSRSFGLMELNMMSLYGYQLGSFIEVVLLSLALGERISQLQKEKKLNQQALVSSQRESIQHLKNYEDLYHNSVSGQFQLNAQNKMIKGNPAWAKIIGVESEQLADGSIDFDNLFETEDEKNIFWKKLINKGVIQGEEVHFKNTASGQSVITSITLREGQESEDAKWIGSAQDITQKYQHEQSLKLAQKERTESLKQLVMGVAHEMNTPLGNLNMVQSFIQDSLPKDGNQDLLDGFKIIENNVNELGHLSKLMKGVVVSNQQWHEQALDLPEWLEDWQKNSLASYPNATINVNVAEAATTINLCYMALEIVLTHLLLNSVMHNNEAYEQKQLVIELNAELNGNLLLLNYTDNGKGVSEQDQAKIFQPFYTTQRQQAEGKGLGLYRSYNLITEVLNGAIEWPQVESGFSLNLVVDLTPEHS